MYKNDTPRLPDGKREIVPHTPNLPDNQTQPVRGYSVRPRSIRSRLFPFMLTMLVAFMIAIGAITGYIGGLGDDITVTTPIVIVEHIEPTIDAGYVGALSEAHATATVAIGGAAVHNEASEAIAAATVAASQIDVEQHSAIVDVTVQAAEIDGANYQAIGAATATAAAVQSAAVAAQAERENDVQAVAIEATKSAINLQATISAYDAQLRMDAMRNDALRQFERQSTMASIGTGSASTLAVVAVLAVVVAVIRHNWNDDAQRIVNAFTVRLTALTSWAARESGGEDSADFVTIRRRVEPVEQSRPTLRPALNGDGSLTVSARPKQPTSQLIKFSYVCPDAGYTRHRRVVVPTVLYRKLPVMARLVMADDRRRVSRKFLAGVLTQQQHRDMMEIFNRYEFVEGSGRNRKLSAVGLLFVEQMSQV